MNRAKGYGGGRTGKRTHEEELNHEEEGDDEKEQHKEENEEEETKNEDGLQGNRKVETRAETLRRAIQRRKNMITCLKTRMRIQNTDILNLCNCDRYFSPPPLTVLPEKTNTQTAHHYNNTEFTVPSTMYILFP